MTCSLSIIVKVEVSRTNDFFGFEITIFTNTVLCKTCIKFEILYFSTSIFSFSVRNESDAQEEMKLCSIEEKRSGMVLKG